MEEFIAAAKAGITSIPGEKWAFTLGSFSNAHEGRSARKDLPQVMPRFADEEHVLPRLVAHHRCICCIAEPKIVYASQLQRTINAT